VKGFRSPVVCCQCRPCVPGWERSLIAIFRSGLQAREGFSLPQDPVECHSKYSNLPKVGYNRPRESARQPLRDPVMQRKVRAPQGRVPGNTWAVKADGKCHRKYTAALWAVRVKWCGKSAPRRWQHRWQGKPHPEQDQIGTPWRGPRWVRVGCSRYPVTDIPDEWLSTTEPGLSAGSRYPKTARMRAG